MAVSLTLILLELPAVVYKVVVMCLVPCPYILSGFLPVQTRVSLSSFTKEISGNMTGENDFSDMCLAETEISLGSCSLVN